VTGMADEHVSRALNRRLAALASSGDASLVLDRRAAEEVDALRTSMGWPPFGAPPPAAALRRDLDHVLLAGLVQFIRGQELPPGDRVDGWLAAMELFTAIYPVAPEAVPEPMRDMCAALAGHPPRVHHAELHNEAIDVLDAAEVSRDLESVDQGIWLVASAFLTAPSDGDRARHLSVLGTAWTQRFRITGRDADLDNAVAAHRRALALGVPDPADQAGHHANLSSALLARYEKAGRAPDLDEAVTVARAATKIAAGPRPAWPGDPGQDRSLAARSAARTSQSALAAALLRRYLHERAQSDLDEAVEAGRRAVGAAPPGDPARAGMQANLANLLLERFTRQWRRDDLAEAVNTAREAAAAAGRRDPARAAALSALALAHLDHFQYSGHLDDLEQAVSAGREAVAATGDGHPGAASALSNLGVALRARYERTGDTGALDEAIAVLRRAVHAAPAEHVSMPGFMNNLGNALRHRFGAGAATVPPSADPADIRESVAMLTEAVAAAHPEAPDRAGYVANLASALVQAAGNGGGPDALDRAIGILDREIGSVAAGHPLRHIYLMSLGNAWLARYDALTADDTAAAAGQALDAAVGYLRRAAAAIPARHPHRAEYLGLLGGALRRRFDRSGDRRTAREAIEASSSAAAIGTAPAVIRALAARDWGEVAARAGDAAGAMAGLAAAVDLLDEVAWRGLRRPDQERNLGRFAALACDAAAWAVEAGQPERAVELLEQGRGILLAQSLDRRARHHDLTRAAPDLAGELTRIDEALERFPSADDPLRAADTVLAARRDELGRQREAVLALIRARPGFADFLRRPSFARLKQAAAAGPVVFVNVSGYRCDALTVTPGGVRVTPLTGLNGPDIVRNVSAFMDAVRESADGTVISGTLAWLWETVAAPLLPVLEAACAAQAAPRPRVWWCPTGPLTFVPLHAAGRHDQGGSLLGRFVSSYTPTLRLLLRTRAREGPPPGRAGRPLLVAMPAELPSAAEEADDYLSRFGHALQFRDAGATVGDVRRALEHGPPLAHFACHGLQDVVHPARGNLSLHEGSLGITDVAELRLDSAELAYLSACETSTGGIQLSDEVITVATAFRLAGYRHVIGTLWSISDRLAPAVAREFYRGLEAPGGEPAVALDAAIRALRDRWPSRPWLWASYIHVGP
jgi:tetratricopeptide (TPR) repeat protein